MAALELIAEFQRYQRKEEKKLDFIIHYDIKYRMGQEGAEDSEE